MQNNVVCQSHNIPCHDGLTEYQYTVIDWGLYTVTSEREEPSSQWEWEKGWDTHTCTHTQNVFQWKSKKGNQWPGTLEFFGPVIFSEIGWRNIVFFWWSWCVCGWGGFSGTLNETTQLLNTINLCAFNLLCNVYLPPQSEWDDTVSSSLSWPRFHWWGILCTRYLWEREPEHF